VFSVKIETVNQKIQVVRPGEGSIETVNQKIQVVRPGEGSIGQLIELEIQDLLGRKMLHWEPKTYSPGNQTLFFDTTNWPAGMYRIVFRQGNQKQEQKLMVR
jgi:hypothetical protein